MVDFSALKKNSGKASLEKLANDFAKQNDKGGGSTDDRFWYPNVDKSGNGYSVIRFLPAAGTEKVPFVRVFSHGFKGPTGLWYIENSLTTIGHPDPVSELNSVLWNQSDDDNSEGRKQARAQKRKLAYISNILVIEDKLNPENNGKVKLFKYGKKIFDKLNAAMNPEFEDEEPMNPFDLWNGANFKLKIRMVEGYRNYDKSEFSDRSPLDTDDSVLESIWKQEYELQPFLAPSNFKSYDELKKKLNKVLGKNGDGTIAPAAARQVNAEREERKSREDVPFEPTRTFNQARASSDQDESQDDEDIKFFQGLGR